MTNCRVMSPLAQFIQGRESFALVAEPFWRILRAGMTAAWLIGLLAVGRSAHAEDVPGTEVQPSSPWDFTIGMGVINTARYPGSRYDYTRVLPLVSVRYGRIFFGALPDANIPAGLGVNFIQRSHWRFGSALGADIRKPRYASDDPVLRGWGDIKSTARAALFGGYSCEFFALNAGLSQDIAGKHEGLLANLSMEGRLHPTERLTLAAGPELTWANRQYMRTFFGVSASQSATARIPQYDVGSGLENWRFSLGANYRITDRWFVVARASYGRYEGDAADSPVTTSKDMHMYALFAGYHF